jgi:hypothetical protein
MTTKDGKKEGDELWACKDGRILYVSEMSESHVRGVLNMILRQRRMSRQRKRELMAIAMSEDSFWDSDDK